jgi:recombination protein RecR
MLGASPGGRGSGPASPTMHPMSHGDAPSIPATDAPQSPTPSPLPAREPRSPRAQNFTAPKAGGSTAYPETVQRLIEHLARLPGIGRRSAERLAFHVLKLPTPEALELSQAIADVKRTVRHCAVCFNLADADSDLEAQGKPTEQPVLCSVCRAPTRDRSVVMVVEQPKDLIALEQTGMYKGVYHVLMGRISPLDGVGPGDVTIAELVKRVQDPSRNTGGEPVKEVVLALNPTLEADGTALYIAQQLAARKNIKVTRLARGIPTGTQLEYANKAVLADAIEGRQAMS